MLNRTQQKSYSISHLIYTVTTPWLESDCVVTVDISRQSGDCAANGSALLTLDKLKRNMFSCSSPFMIISNCSSSSIIWHCMIIGISIVDRYALCNLYIKQKRNYKVFKVSLPSWEISLAYVRPVHINHFLPNKRQQM